MGFDFKKMALSKSTFDGNVGKSKYTCVFCGKTFDKDPKDSISACKACTQEAFDTVENLIHLNQKEGN